MLLRSSDERFRACNPNVQSGFVLEKVVGVNEGRNERKQAARLRLQLVRPSMPRRMTMWSPVMLSNEVESLEGIES